MTIPDLLEALRPFYNEWWEAEGEGNKMALTVHADTERWSVSINVPNSITPVDHHEPGNYTLGLSGGSGLLGQVVVLADIKVVDDRIVEIKMRPNASWYQLAPLLQAADEYPADLRTVVSHL